MPSGVIVSFELAIAVVLILVVLPILWWIILALTGGFGRFKR
jgi:hypothetical protein